jgi:hypothetical protein
MKDIKTTMAVFDAKGWITSNCAGGHELAPETLHVVSSFTLMWNLFENTACNTSANIKTFEHIAASIAERGDDPAEIATALQFWKKRYYGESKFNSLFEGLAFRDCDRREFVEAVLSGAVFDAKNQLLAVMIIVYRLRNNLFHGLKEISTLNEQVANLDVACRVLAAILRVSVMQ